MTVDKMTVGKMTVDKMTVGKMTVYIMTRGEKTVNKMTEFKMPKVTRYVSLLNDDCR